MFALHTCTAYDITLFANNAWNRRTTRHVVIITGLKTPQQKRKRKYLETATYKN